MNRLDEACVSVSCHYPANRSTRVCTAGRIKIVNQQQRINIYFNNQQNAHVTQIKNYPRVDSSFRQTTSAVLFTRRQSTTSEITGSDKHLRPDDRYTAYMYICPTAC